MRNAGDPRPDRNEWLKVLDWPEILGYAASVLVAASLTMKSLARLRVLNLAGALLFVLYGAWVDAYPVLAVNGFIAVVNVAYLLGMRPGRAEAFDLLGITRADNAYLRRFLEFHARDIRRFFPGFDLDAVEDPRIVLILRDMLPVGLVVCDRPDLATLRVRLDYVVPSHRDFRCAEHFYRSWRRVMDAEGIERFTAETDLPRHRRYLERLGFRPEPGLGPGWFARPA